eukprot:gene11323-23932_t
MPAAASRRGAARRRTIKHLRSPPQVLAHQAKGECLRASRDIAEGEELLSHYRR